MSKKSDPERIDSENPEWSAADFASARPASEGLPSLFGAEQAAAMLKPRRGRPPATVRKEHVNLRLDPEVLEAFRASGPGWQTRLNAALADWLRSHSPAEMAG
jgi:uncharacterized protein (DUF4415 family)